eukprot:1154313-Pelagomonas_calceolata.AAC.3
MKTQLCIYFFGKIGSVSVLECTNGKKGGIVVEMANFQPTPFCSIYPQMCSSDIADFIANKTGSIGGLAGSGWAKTSWGVGGPLSPQLYLHTRSTSQELHISLHMSSSIIIRPKFKIQVKI